MSDISKAMKKLKLAFIDLESSVIMSQLTPEEGATATAQLDLTDGTRSVLTWVSTSYHGNTVRATSEQASAIHGLMKEFHTERRDGKTEWVLTKDCSRIHRL